MPKYKFVNGIMQLNYAAPLAMAPHVLPLAIVANEDDLAEVTKLQDKLGYMTVVPQSTLIAIGEFENSEFISRYKCPNLNGYKILHNLSYRFAHYEVPVGMLSKLLALSEYKVNIILDDSGSMMAETDSIRSHAGGYMLEYFKQTNCNLWLRMRRWEAQEDRLHTMIDFLAYIPTSQITISFLNRSDIIVLKHDGKTPDFFAAEAHEQINACFRVPPALNNGIPTMAKMKAVFESASGLTMHYFFMNGVPSDCSIYEVGEFLAKRPNPSSNPITFVNCTNVESEAKWMKEIEASVAYISEIDNYYTELQEVRRKQGLTFPYSKGLWLMCLLVGAINPHDLDALDDSRPISKFTLDNLMGRVLTEEEYNYYWRYQPRNTEFAVHFKRLAEESNSTLGMFGPRQEVSESAENFSKLRW